MNVERRKKSVLDNRPNHAPEIAATSILVANSILSKFLILWQHNLCAHHIRCHAMKFRWIEMRRRQQRRRPGNGNDDDDDRILRYAWYENAIIS